MKGALAAEANMAAPPSAAKGKAPPSAAGRKGILAAQHSGAAAQHSGAAFKAPPPESFFMFPAGRSGI
jgi:hypothetical protein